MKELLEKIKTQAKFVKVDELGSIFDNALDRMKKSFNKLEKEQYYDCDANDIYYKFLDEDYEGLVEELRDFSKVWPPLNWKENNSLEINRLHLVNYPLNKYLEYEMYFYLINKRGGEIIKCLDVEQTNYKLNELEDFIIFDDNEIIINAHDNKGILLGSYHLIDNTGLIKQLLDEFKLLFDRGQDFEECYQFDEAILKELKEINLI